jgi:hypothetical protein
MNRIHLTHIDRTMIDHDPATAENFSPHTERADAILRGVLDSAINAPILSFEPARRRQGLRLAVAAVAVAVVGAGAAIGAASNSHGASPQHVIAGSRIDATHLVDFTTRDGNVIAKITDPFAAASELDAVFQAYGLDVTVNLIPVRPAKVGQIIEVTENGASVGGPDIHSIMGGGCSNPVSDGANSGCWIGLVFSPTFQGPAVVYVGRPALPGETAD